MNTGWINPVEINPLMPFACEPARNFSQQALSAETATTTTLREDTIAVFSARSSAPLGAPSSS